MARYEQNIVVDLEFTPVNRGSKSQMPRYEIIQIGAVRVSPNGAIKDSFCSYVKPEYAQQISRKVERLTGIRTSDVKEEEAIATVIEKFRRWIGSSHTRFVSWSKNDLQQLRIETANKNVFFPEGDQRWLDLQTVYPRFLEITDGRLMALRVAAEWYGIAVSPDDLHDALHDARLTAELLSSLITKEYLEQKDALAAAMPEKSNVHTVAFPISAQCSSLLQFKMSLKEKSGTSANPT